MCVLTLVAWATRTDSVSYLDLDCTSSCSVGFSARRRTRPTIDSTGCTTIAVTSIESIMYLHAATQHRNEMVAEEYFEGWEGGLDTCI